MSDKAKFAYLAGIIDGEGCVTIGAGRKGNVTNYNSTIFVATTAESLAKWLTKHFGGTYYVRKSKNVKWKTAYIWRYLKKAEIETLLLAVLPYLIIKREQAILLLKFVRLSRMEQSAVREELYQQMKLLNKRGMDSVTTNTQDTEETVKIESELIGDYESELMVT